MKSLAEREVEIRRASAGIQPIPLRLVGTLPMAATPNDRLWACRKNAGMSQGGAARASGVGVKTISSFETGERIHTVKVAQLLRLLDAYGVTPSEFFEGLEWPR